MNNFVEDFKYYCKLDMPIINSIPSQYESGFEELAKLKEEEFIKIRQSLEQVPFASSIDNLVAKMYQSSNIEADLEDIFSSIGSLVPYIDSKEIIPEIVDDIANLSIQEDFLNAEDSREFVERLMVLLTAKQVLYASKADDLISNYSNKFILSRVITDIRPIFDLDLNENVQAGMIIHNLTIHYQANEEPYHKNFTVALTPDNIAELRSALDRAENKEEMLKTIFKRSDIVDLNE